MPLKIKCDKCNYELTTQGYKKHYEKCNGTGPRWIRSLSPNRECRFCGKAYPAKSLGAHSVGCKQNPRHELNRKKAADTRRGVPISEKAKRASSETIKKKVEEGTWHCSFSRSRTYEYNGVKLHGQWEVKYAQYLDSLGVKWRRPTEKFPYYFQEKNSWYTPDFYLEDEQVYVEIKGYKTPKDEAKWRDFPLDLKVLRGPDLVALGLLEPNEVKLI